MGGGSSPPLEPLRRRGLCEFPAGSSSLGYALHATDVLFLLSSTFDYLSAILAPRWAMLLFFFNEKVEGPEPLQEEFIKYKESVTGNVALFVLR